MGSPPAPQPAWEPAPQAGAGRGQGPGATGTGQGAGGTGTGQGAGGTGRGQGDGGTGRGQGDGAVEPARRTGGAKPATKHPFRLAGSVYAGIAVFLIILIIVMDFILQNLDRADIHLFTARFHLPVGIMVLLGAIGGALVMLLISLFLHFTQMRRAHREKAQSATS